MVNDKTDEKKTGSDEEGTKDEVRDGDTGSGAASETEERGGTGAGAREQPQAPGRGEAPAGRDREDEDEEDFGALLEESFKKRDFDEGEVIRGLVVEIHKDFVMVNIGGKSEGHVPLDEFKDESGEIKVEINQEVEVIIDRREDEDGFIRLSKDKAEKRRTWEDLEDAYRNERPVKGRITEKVKGGLMVDVGVMAFLPGSQADVKPIRNLEKLIGLEDNFLIIKFNRKRGNVVVSRRMVLERHQESQRSTTLDALEKDKVVKGVVKNITEYGAFIDLGGIDGLLHITDMSWGRISHPSEIMSVGDEVTVVVTRFNRETEKVSLSLKRLLPDPWTSVEKKYPVGTLVMGRVVSVTDYGAFVELEQGVEGLVHVSEMSWSKKRIHPSKIVQPDQEIEAKVLDIDPMNRRISLSLKGAQQNPWDMLELKYPRGSRITGKIRNITNFGVFVGVEEGIDGLVHISDLSWTKRVKHPSELFKKGQEVECVVLEIDKDHERFSLSIKEAQEDPWIHVPSKYRPGQDVEGKVVNITDFGVFVELEEGIEGLIHISELSHEKVKDPSDLVKPGQEITAEILNVDVSERKIRLSVKALQRGEDDAAYQTFQKQEGDGTSKLGELIQDQLSRIRMADRAADDATGQESAEQETQTQPEETEKADAAPEPTPDGKQDQSQADELKTEAEKDEEPATEEDASEDEPATEEDAAEDEPATETDDEQEKTDGEETEEKE